MLAPTSRFATLSVSAVGDMIFDRRVKVLIGKCGAEATLANVASHLAQADVTVGNLESNLATSGTRNAARDVTLQGSPKADGIANVRVVPVYLDSYGKPSVVTGSAASAILSRLNDISAKRGTAIEITGDTAAVAP